MCPYPMTFRTKIQAEKYNGEFVVKFCWKNTEGMSV